MKYLANMLVAGLMVVQAFAATGYAAPAEEITDGKVYLETVYREMGLLQSFRTDVVITVKTPIADLSAAIAADAYQGKNKVYKAVLDCTLTEPNGKVEKVRAAQYYIEEKADEIMLYTNADKVWVKSAMAQEKSGKPDIAAVMQLMKSASVKKQDADMVTLDVVVDMEKIGDVITKAFDKMESKAKEESEVAKKKAMEEKKVKEMIALVVKNMGDISYEVTLDRKANRIVNLEADLTKPVQECMGAIMAEKEMTKQQKAMISSFLQGIQIHITEEISQFNQVKPFDIPKAVRKNAVDEAVYKKEMKKEASAIGFIGQR